MKLSMLKIVDRTAEALDKVTIDIEAAEKDLFVVYIADRPQDDAMTAAVRFAVLAELQGRKASLERDLKSYGVEIS